MPALFLLDRVTCDFHVGRDVVRALDAVSLEIGEGDYVSLTGPSGSGKSVLLHVLALLATPDSGSVHFLGRAMDRMHDEERAYLRSLRLGIVFQRPWMIDRLDLAHNIALPLRYRSVPPADALREARLALRTVGLEDRAHHRPGGLSGGQLQLAGLARALVGRPSVIVADEPTSALDEESRTLALRLLHRANREHGSTVIHATHDHSEARLAHRIVRLEAGKIVSDHPGDASDRPSQPAGAALVP
jgi:putative ABC transport system ATP-binding protein